MLLEHATALRKALHSPHSYLCIEGTTCQTSDFEDCETGQTNCKCYADIAPAGNCVGSDIRSKKCVSGFTCLTHLLFGFIVYSKLGGKQNNQFDGEQRSVFEIAMWLFYRNVIWLGSEHPADSGENMGHSRKYVSIGWAQS